jgi:hypothetical protein
VLCYYSRRWLLASSSYIQIRTFHVHVEITPTTLDVIVRCVILCVSKLLPSKVLLFGRLRWSTMEGTHAWLCIMSSFQCAWKNWPIVGYCHYQCAMYIVWAILEETTIFICDWCSRGWHMGYFVTPLEKILVRKWFFPWCTKQTKTIL